MKKLHLLFVSLTLISIFVLNTIQAQDYVAFPDSNAIWSEVFTNDQPFEIETYQYGISGDTLINSIVYHKVYMLNDTVYPIIPGQYCGAIREDNSKRIFAIGCDCAYPGSGENEVILYDFSKAIGDTVFVGIEGIGPEWYLIINHIDSLLIDNTFRKTFHFTSNQEYFWIEGIGSTRGLFSPIVAQPTGFQKWKLICFNQEGVNKYLNPAFNSCFPTLTGIYAVVEQNGQLQIYPHPVTDISVIDLSNAKSKYQYLEFYNLVGQKIDQININGRKQIHINRVNYKPGLYIYRIISQDNKSIIGKLIIE